MIRGRTTAAETGRSIRLRPSDRPHQARVPEVRSLAQSTGDRTRENARLVGMGRVPRRKAVVVEVEAQMTRQLSRYVGCVVVVLASLGVILFGQSGKPNSPNGTQKTHRRVVEVAGGLEGLWRFSDAVLAGLVLEPRTYEMTSASGVTFILARRAVKITEVFKQTEPLSVGDIIFVDQQVGSRYDGRIEEVENAVDVLTTDAVHALFLTAYAREPKVYSLATGASSSYRQSGKDASTPARSVRRIR